MGGAMGGGGSQAQPMGEQRACRWPSWRAPAANGKAAPLKGAAPLPPGSASPLLKSCPPPLALPPPPSEEYFSVDQNNVF